MNPNSKPAVAFTLIVTGSSGHTFTVTSKRAIATVFAALLTSAKTALGKE